MLKKKIYAYLVLSKPGISCLSTFSALIGISISLGRYNLEIFNTILILFLVFIGSAGSAAYNMWYEVDIDKEMGSRTNKRPILANTISKNNALIFSICMSSISVFGLYYIFNFISALLMFLAIIFYDLIYTMWLKKNCIHNTEIGGISGGFPPLIGYSAVTNNLSFSVLIISIIVILWSAPHFWALAIKNVSNYRKVSIPMLPVIKGIKITKFYILLYIISLAVITIFPITIILEDFNTSLVYALTCLIINTIFIYYAIMLFYNNSYAYKLFKFSIIYLFILFSAILVDSL